MVGHFLQPNRRNRSLSQPTNSANTNGAVSPISGSSIVSGSINTGNVIPVIASHTTHNNNATIDVNANMNSNFGYNVNNVTISTNVNNNSNNTNGTSNHHHYPQHSAMVSSSRYPVTHQTATIAPPTTYDASPSSMQYMPPQNLTAEAVAALPPPGPFNRTFDSLLI
jgi:hypothetical protein